MIFLPALLFGVLLLLLRRTDTIFSFFRRKGKGGKEEDQEERMFLLLGAAVLRRTKGVEVLQLQERQKELLPSLCPQKEGKKSAGNSG